MFMMTMAPGLSSSISQWDHQTASLIQPAQQAVTPTNINILMHMSPMWLCSRHWSSYGRQMIQASTREWVVWNTNERRGRWQWIMPVVRKIQGSTEFEPYTNLPSFIFLAAHIWSCFCHTMKKLKRYRNMYRLKWTARHKNCLKWISLSCKKVLRHFGFSKPNHMSSEIV